MTDYNRSARKSAHHSIAYSADSFSSDSHFIVLGKVEESKFAVWNRKDYPVLTVFGKPQDRVDSALNLLLAEMNEDYIVYYASAKSSDVESPRIRTKFNDTHSLLALMEKLRIEMSRRGQSKDEHRPVILILDNLHALMPNITTAENARVLQLIDLIVRHGAKVNMSLILGMNSLKALTVFGDTRTLNDIKLGLSPMTLSQSFQFYGNEQGMNIQPNSSLVQASREMITVF